MRISAKSYTWLEYLIFLGIMVFTMLISICVGSVGIPLKTTLITIWRYIWRLALAEDLTTSIIIALRLPRTICVALTGAALSLCGGAMQGLLKNPLADGSTLGVSAGASLGAVLAISFGITLPAFPFAGRMVMAMIFAFLSLLIILSLAYKLDHTLSTNTIILIGVIYSMFAGSIINFVVSFSSERIKQVSRWTMGSFSGSNNANALLLFVALIVCGSIILSFAEELNAFAISEDNARHVGVNVKKVKLVMFIAISALLGICVSISGPIGFVGLVTPHIMRMIVGPNHKKLLPMSMIGGAVFLLLSDLVARIILNPIQLPIGIITSFIGSVVFVYVFYTSRRGK